MRFLSTDSRFSRLNFAFDLLLRPNKKSGAPLLSFDFRASSRICLPRYFFSPLFWSVAWEPSVCKSNILVVCISGGTRAFLIGIIFTIDTGRVRYRWFRWLCCHRFLHICWGEIARLKFILIFSCIQKNK